MSETTSSAIGPVPGADRITAIDCLRGAALLGILIANMRGFNAPLAAYIRPQLMWTWMPDRVAQALVDWLVSGKFITIFAALFGIGFAIQMDRAEARGLDTNFYFRRMLALLAIGIVHAFAIWWGDILITYAICGIFLMMFRTRTQDAMLWWAMFFYWLIVAVFTAAYVSTLAGYPLPQETPVNKIPELVRIYASGTFREIFAARVQEWREANEFPIFLTRILGIFLFGVYLWRQGYLQRPSEHLDWWKRAQRIGLSIGLAGNLAVVLIDWIFNPNIMEVSGLTGLVLLLLSIATPALSLGYAATLVLLWQHPAWQRRLRPFSYVGRMALTNYLLQSVICTTIFYSYGFGLYGRVGPLADLFLALAIYALQVPFSKWWLERYRYGPVEWLWRRMTYGAHFTDDRRADASIT